MDDTRVEELDKLAHCQSLTANETTPIPYVVHSLVGSPFCKGARFREDPYSSVSAGSVTESRFVLRMCKKASPSASETQVVLRVCEVSGRSLVIFCDMI